jgi:hypothetical protein
LYVNEFNEGDFYADDDYIVNDSTEKLNVSLIFGRTERRERKMALVPGVGMNLPHGKPYIYQEFPKAMFHRKLGTCVVQDTIEAAAKRKEGWTDTPAKFKREDAIIKRIEDLETELVELVAEYEKLTGEDYEETMEKKRRRDAAEAKLTEAKGK